ncbi:MAG TPA: DEAD/DEAH box helicase [Candidatus Micrarchaeaceae archaeon]|nr:DEAD/DEAH box helicase [Candidatus Micrarchaeaceae archaeon]
MTTETTRELESFQRTLPFQMDPFQLEAIRALERHQGVLVSAPTSSGKTVVAEWAIWRCLAQRDGEALERVLYTSPLKALSNQKFGDLCQRYGEGNVGLVTGETSIRPFARVVVMTTEILRNLVYDDPLSLERVAWVILDEIHYIDEYPRGTVWEEVIVQSPQHIKFIGLSATITNVDEVAAWMTERRGQTAVVVRQERPVELRSWLGMRNQLLPLLDSEGRLDRRTLETAQQDRSGDRRMGGGRLAWASENDMLRILDQLAERDMLPAIYFIFSRRGCREALARCSTHRVDFTSLEQKFLIDEVLAERLAEVDDPEEAELYVRSLAMDLLRRGIAMHHAGLLPYVKETIEALFQRGLLKVVFATETLALGLNMPARACVISTFTKFDGQGFAALRSGQLAQLLGRAGRRGIDSIGHGVILRDPEVDLGVICETLLGNDMAVESKFAPTYNMTLNLLRRHTPKEAEELLEQSFGQYQRIRALDNLRERRPNLEARLDDLRRRRFRHPRVACTERTLSQFVGARNGLDQAREESRKLRRQHFRDRHRGRFGDGTQDPGGRLERLRRTIRQEERRLASSPCPGCPLLSDHLGSRREVEEIQVELEGAEAAAQAREHEYRTQLGAYRSVLAQLGYLIQDRPTRLGLLAAAVYGENTLLVAQTVADGWLDEMAPEEICATLVMLAAEDRNADRPSAKRRMPTARLERVARRLRQAQRELAALEAEWGLSESRSPSLDYVEYVYHWARGVPLTELQPPAGVDAGDALRATKAGYALARQLEQGLAGWPLQGTVARARASLERDLVRRL